MSQKAARDTFDLGQRRFPGEGEGKKFIDREDIRHCDVHLEKGRNREKPGT